MFGIKEDTIETELLDNIDKSESLFKKEDIEGGFKKLRFSKGSQSLIAISDTKVTIVDTTENQEFATLSLDTSKYSKIYDFICSEDRLQMMVAAK